MECGRDGSHGEVPGLWTLTDFRNSSTPGFNNGGYAYCDQDSALALPVESWSQAAGAASVLSCCPRPKTKKFVFPVSKMEASGHASCDGLGTRRSCLLSRHVGIADAIDPALQPRPGRVSQRRFDTKSTWREMGLGEADRERGRRFVTRLYSFGFIAAAAFGLVAVFVWPQGADRPAWFWRFLVGWGSFGLLCLLAPYPWYAWRAVRDNKQARSANDLYRR